MVKTNIQTFTGEVEILSNLHVGSYLTANGDASNVLDVTGNVGASFFVGDGGLISNIATTLSDIVDQGNLVANVVQFNAPPAVFAGVGIVTASNVGIQNANPLNTLSIANKIIIDKDVSEPSTTMNVHGKVYASRFEGDGGLLSNIATTLEAIINQGNVSANVVKFSSATDYAGAGLVTDSNVGIQNTAPVFNLSVGSNVHIDDKGSNVLTVHGNVSASNLNLGVFTVSASHGLDQVCAESNVVTRPVRFSNVITAVSAVSNIESAGTFISTDAERGLDVASNIDIGGRLKFDSNVFVDTLRIADVASNIVTYDRATGELTDSSGTFMNKFAVVSEQPPSDLFANTTTVTNHGGYTLTTSNLATNSNTYNAFDGTANAWVSGDLAGGYIGGANVFHQTNLTQLSNLHPTQHGDWLAIEFPYKTTLRHMKLTPLTATQFPASANLYATNNDLTWTEINYWKDVVPASDTAVQTITVNATEQFKKYALVATKAGGNGSSNVALQDWQLFTESFSIDGGKVAMAQQAATGGETVMDQHGPHGRLSEPVPLKKYPEIVFEEGKFDRNDSTNTYIQAGYTVSASTVESSSRATWKVFNNIFTEGNGWRGTGSYSSTDGLFTGTFVDFTNGGQSIATADRGEWLKITLPEKIKLDHFILQPRNSTTDGGNGVSYGRSEFVKDGAIWGSNDGSSWSKIYTINATLPSDTSLESFTVPNSTIAYNNFVLVVTKTQGASHGAGANGVLASFSEWELYGYEEDPPLGDTSVDTTFKSIMNTPQTTGANVYVDGSLGETFTNRVVGPTVSNTHTTYVSAEKYWELSGNVESNVTLEANTFLSGDAPHSLSMWFNSSNLVSNASNSCIFSLGTEERLDHVGAAFSNTYQTVQKLLASDGGADDRFGAGNESNGLSMSGDGSVVVVGSKLDDAKGSDAGAVYIFIKDANGHWTEVQKLLASDGAADDRFGCGTDISSDGNYIAIGARLAHSTDGNNTSNVGKLYIFKRTVGTNTWSEQQILSSSHESEDDHFGRRVSISSDGTYVVSTAQNDDQSVSNGGAAYVFKRTGSTWNTTPFRLFPSDGSIGASEFFGSSIEISNDGKFVVVGASRDASNNGSVFIFARTAAAGDNTWSQQQKISNPDVSGSNNYFGEENQGVSNSSSDGTYLIVGAYGRASENGAIFFFQRTGSSTSDWAWSIMGSVQTNPTGDAGDLFGRAVKMSPDGLTALVHSRDDTGADDAGAVFVYKRSGSTWTYTSVVRHSGRSAADRFGSALAISTDASYFVAGSWPDDDNGTNAGAAYIFTRDTTHHLTTDLKLQSNTWHNLTYAYQGEGGSRVTYLDGRKVAEDQAEDTFGEYPPFAMTGYKTGGYCVSASSELGSAYLAHEAFNGTFADNGDAWLSVQQASGAHNYSGGSGAYVGTANLGSDSGGPAFANADKGEWLKLEMPYKFVLDYITICGSTDVTVNPKNWKIYGSNDDKNWDVLLSKTNTVTVAYNATSGKEHTVGATKAYKYFALVVTATNGFIYYTQVGELEFYGHRENDLVRLPDPTNVLKYPHIAMTGPAQRGYVFTASSQHSTSGEIYSRGIDNGYLFDGDPATVWHIETNGTDDHRYDGSTNSYGTDSISNFDPTGINIKGEWVQLELPHKVKISKVLIRARSTHLTQAPKDFAFYGSDTAAAGSWTLIQSFTGEAPQGNGNSYAITSNPVHYKYILMLITRVVGTTALTIAELEYYGTEEASPVPLQIGGGNIDKVANFRVYDKFIEEDQALEIWDAQKDEFGRAKSSMTLQKGRLGLGTTEPQGRLAVADEPDATTYGLQEFPPKPLVGYKTHIEGHGEFCTSASSSQNTTSVAWKAFDKLYDISSASTTWSNFTNSNYNGTDNTYNSAVDQHRLGKGAVNGEWIKLELPYKINLEYMKLNTRAPNDLSRLPEDFKVYGSNDGSNWTELISVIRRPKVFETTHYTNINSMYRYFGVVVTKISGQPNYFRILELRYFGYREQVTKQSVLHDGQLTLTKNLNVPRIGPALDADDTPRRDRLVVEYNTSTNPTFEGAVRDTSGRGNDGVFVGTAAYDATEKAFTFSGTDPSIHRVRGLGSSLKGNQQLSASFWTKINADVDQGFFSVGNTSTVGKCFGFRLDVGSSNYNLEVSYSGSASTSLYRYRVTELDTPNDGKWRHFVAINAAGTKTANGTTYDYGATSATRLFLDGVELFTMSSSTYGNGVVGSASDVLNLDPNPTLSIGSFFDGAFDMNGSISNFKLYDTALTTDEVKTLYDMGRCDEGGHVVNFSKTRVGIGLGDGALGDGAYGYPSVLNIRGNQETRGDIILKDASSELIFNHSDIAKWKIRHNGGDNAGGKLRFDHWYYSGGIYKWNEHGFLTWNGTAQMNFTGQHKTFIKDVPFSQADGLYGLIVSSDQNKYIKMSNGIEAGSNAITTNESLPIVSLSNVVTDKKCFGVISASEDPEQRTEQYGVFGSNFEKEKGDTRVYINSVGEGAIWVSNIGGSLESGDYITTSNVAGYGQKQEGAGLMNYTVAKITMDCDFNPATQPIQQILRSNVIQTYYLGDVHHTKTVPHEFVTTTVGADDTWSNVSIKPSDVTYAEWSNLEANTQNTYTLTYSQTSNVVYDTKYTLTTTANVTESDSWDRVSIDPPGVTYAEYSNLEANTQSSYSLTFTQTTTDTKTPGAWSNLESNTQSLYNMVYYQSVEEEVAAEWPGATTHTRVTDVIENELDAHGQIQWEDHATETEKAYKIRYLDVSGAQTDSANAVHIAAFVGCTYHCG